MKKTARRCSCCRLNDLADNGTCPHCDRACKVPVGPDNAPKCPACIAARRIAWES